MIQHRLYSRHTRHPGRGVGRTAQFLSKGQRAAPVVTLEASPGQFSRQFERDLRQLKDVAGRLADAPDGEAVHDLRVAARRAQAMCTLLPKRARSGKLCEFESSLKAALKGTSRARDLDILAATLNDHLRGLPPGMSSLLAEGRRSAIEAARATGAALSAATLPETGEIKVGRGLTKRLRKRAERRRQRVERLLGEVVADETEVEALHSLRKETKKLRYLLEVADEPPVGVGELEAWQRDLGAIHDLDVAIDYVRDSRLRFDKRDLLAGLGEARRSAYARFMKGYKSGVLRALKSSLS